MTGSKKEKRNKAKGEQKQQKGKKQNRGKRPREERIAKQAEPIKEEQPIRSTLKRRLAQRQNTQDGKPQEEGRKLRSTLKRRKLELQKETTQANARTEKIRKRKLQEEEARQTTPEMKGAQTQQARSTMKRRMQAAPRLTPGPQGNGACPPSLSGTREEGQATLLEGPRGWSNPGPHPPKAPSGTGALGGGGMGKGQRGKGGATKGSPRVGETPRLASKRARSPGPPLDHVPGEQAQDPLCPSTKRAALQSPTSHRVAGGKQGRPTKTKLN